MEKIAEGYLSPWAKPTSAQPSRPPVHLPRHARALAPRRAPKAAAAGSASLGPSRRMHGMLVKARTPSCPLDTRTRSLLPSSLRSARSKNPRRTVAAAVGFAWPPCSPRVAAVSAEFAVLVFVDYSEDSSPGAVLRAHGQFPPNWTRRRPPFDSSPSNLRRAHCHQFLEPGEPLFPPRASSWRPVRRSRAGQVTVAISPPLWSWPRVGARVWRTVRVKMLAALPSFERTYSRSRWHTKSPSPSWPCSLSPPWLTPTSTPAIPRRESTTIRRALDFPFVCAWCRPLPWPMASARSSSPSAVAGICSGEADGWVPYVSD